VGEAVDYSHSATSYRIEVFASPRQAYQLGSFSSKFSAGAGPNLSSMSRSLRGLRAASLSAAAVEGFMEGTFRRGRIRQS
jgi:hypothetical protein